MFSILLHVRKHISRIMAGSTVDEAIEAAIHLAAFEPFQITDRNQVLMDETQLREAIAQRS